MGDSCAGFVERLVTRARPNLTIAQRRLLVADIMRIVPPMGPLANSPGVRLYRMLAAASITKQWLRMRRFPRGEEDPHEAAESA